MGVELRTMTEADLDVADGVVVAAFGSARSHRPDLARYLALEPEGWLLATSDGVPAGVVGTVIHGPFAYIGQMGVHPEMQRRGIARALMERLLAYIERRGCPMALLDATESGAPLYRSLGFVEDEKTYVFARAAEDAALPSAHGAVEPLHPSRLAEVVALDAPIFGADRRRVLAAYLREFPDRTLLHRGRDGGIDGFLIAQGQRLGPWVARDAAAAEALLTAALALPFAGPPIVNVPESHEAAMDLMRRAGFSVQRATRHMRRGGAPGSARRVFGQASFAVG